MPPCSFLSGRHLSYVFGYSTGTIGYKLAYASSIYGIKWEGNDAVLGLVLSADGFESEVMAYSSVVFVDGDFHLFSPHSGHEKHGFGYAHFSAESYEQPKCNTIAVACNN